MALTEEDYDDARKRLEDDPNHCFIPVASEKNITLDLSYRRNGAGRVHFGVDEGNSEQMLDVMSMMEHGGTVRYLPPGRTPNFVSIAEEFFVNGRHFILGRSGDGTFGLLAELQDGHGLLMPL